ncbi:MAG: 2-oxoacid:acceptor oxidoreductase family protein, partial [Pseudomonadota bacterium]|nr:2-oxoacid:acceptor oxidoreductase family protein [Pseudomonadota bacterium]
PGGKLLYNSSIATEVPDRKDIEVVAIPANDIALALGNDRSANMVMLGAFAKLAGVPSIEAIISSIEFLMGKKKSLVEISCKAVTKGADFISA